MVVLTSLKSFAVQRSLHVSQRQIKPVLNRSPLFHLSQDHRAAAALSRHLWQPGEDEASSRGLVEASVCAQRGKAKNGK